jgi:putative tricarboxylic transport membrane protein
MIDLVAQFGQGLLVATSPANLLYCFLGALIGTLIGVLPGLGPITTVALLLPITFHLPPLSALIMLAGIYYGAQYGGSTTAILVNMPGESSSVVTCLDGYRMARQGRAGPALAVAALGSLFAGIVATFVIALFSPVLIGVALLFGPAEYFALMTLGLMFAVVLSSASVFRSLGLIALGLALAMVGTDVNTGAERFTFGIAELRDGIGFVPVAMGLFAVAEIVRNLEGKESRTVDRTPIGRLWPSGQDFRRAWPAALRGTLLGSAIGLLPGGGPTLSAFAAYALEKKISKTPQRFGKGAVEGVAAPEAANNAAAQTSFIPLLTLGLPANPTIALMAGAMMIHGIQPGPQVMTANPELFWGLIASMLVGNVMLVLINLPLIGLWVRLLAVPYHLLSPALVVLCCIGVYSTDNSLVSVGLLLVFGAFGYLLSKWQADPAPLLLAFVLGPMIEENFRRAMFFSGGDPWVFVSRPISGILLLLAALLALIVALPAIRKTRSEAFQETP